MEAHKYLIVVILSSTLLVNMTTAEVCQPDDRKALVGIKTWFKNNPIFSSWVPEKDCCRGWRMVYCDPTTHRVIFLEVGEKGFDLAGTLPPSIADLPYLQNITFRKYPKLTGPIPPSMATLRHLVHIKLDHNTLSGPVPSFLGRLTALRHLDLSFNQFTGTIPSELGLGPALVYLDVSRNKLTGPIPDSFGGLKGSLTLNVSHNELSGSIPPSLGKINLNVLNVSYNGLCGLIPRLGKLPSFDKSCYDNNKCLCGSPLQGPCNAIA